MTQSLVTQSKQSITLDTRLGGGGEGEVWAIRESGDLVAKIYHPDKRTPERQRKLLAMVQNPPADEMRGAYNHVSLCWPIDLLYAGGHFAGFLMPRIGKSPTVLEVYNPALRAKTYPGFNWRYLLRTGQNFAIALGALHRKGYIMGDVNESNILVSDQALVTLIDTDSYQVTDSLGRTYRCPVGKPLYTPPELQGTDLKTVDRKPEHDHFGLGVLLFYLLMEGFHPFNGVMQTRASVGRIEEYCIKQGAFPYRRNGVVVPNPNAPPFDMLPEKIRQLFERCFVEGHRDPGQRPTPEDWHRALGKPGLP